jgi:hypothetical protein
VPFVVGIPFVYFAAIVGSLFLLLGVLGRFFEQPDFNRLKRMRSLSFEIETGCLCITDDGDFKGFRTIGLPNGSYAFDLSLNDNEQVISSVQITPKSNQKLDQFDFPIVIEHALLFIVDAKATQDSAIKRQVRKATGGKLRTPVFEEVKDGERVIGFVVEPGTGNGEYRFRTQDNALVGDFSIPEEP